VPGSFAASTITTARLSLAALTVADADEMAIVLADPALHEFTGGRPATVEELRDRYADWVGGSGSVDELWRNWIVRRNTDDAAVGTVQATIANPTTSPTAFVAWTIGTPWQGNGYAVEAAVALVQWLIAHGAREIVAHVHPLHHASTGVATRAGLERTSVIVDGEVEWRLSAPATAHR
jgi:RimJ/RimL family protein N-acetyltransferase